MSKRYVREHNWAVCTKGQIQADIIVDRQTTTFTNTKDKPGLFLIATEKDRFETNFNCAVIIGAAGLIGAIIGGAVALALGGARAMIIGGVVGGIKAAIEGGIEGAKKGAAKGEKTGSEIGSSVGKGVGTVAGGAIGATAGAGKGAIDGAAKGAKTGGEIGADVGEVTGTVAGIGTGITLSPALVPLTAKGGSVIGREVGKGMGTVEGAKIGAGVGAVKGSIEGGIAGAESGGKTGSWIGEKVGGTIGTVIGGVGGAIDGALENVGSGIISGAKTGFEVVKTIGEVAGSVAGSYVARKAMNYFLPNLCSLFTRFSLWSSVHERVFIERKMALMPDATLPCWLFGGVVSLAIPDMEEAIRAAYASMFIYCDQNEDEVRPEDEKGFFKEFFSDKFYDSDGDNYGGQSYDGFNYYNPEAFGWKEVDPEFAASIAKQADVPYKEYIITDKDGNEYVHHYFYDNESGTKSALYETPEGDYVMVSRGTHNHETGSSTRDWIDDNGQQGLKGESDQYDDDGDIARATREKVDEQNKKEGTNRRFITTGHSMAGGKTTLSGATGKSDATYAFNPAGVHPDMYKKHNVSDDDAAHTFVFSSKNDFLTNLNDNVSIAPNHVGKRIVLNTGSGFFNLADSHDMILLIEEMKKHPNVKVFADND